MHARWDVFFQANMAERFKAIICRNAQMANYFIALATTSYIRNYSTFSVHNSCSVNLENKGPSLAGVACMQWVIWPWCVRTDGTGRHVINWIKVLPSPWWKERGNLSSAYHMMCLSLALTGALCTMVHYCRSNRFSLNPWRQLMSQESLQVA